MRSPYGILRGIVAPVPTDELLKVCLDGKFRADPELRALLSGARSVRSVQRGGVS